jgi:hypothetical protein
MKTRFYLLLLPILFTSCFEIIEEVNLNADGSGNFEYTLNMSQSRKELNSIRNLDSFRNYHIPSETELSASIDRGIAILKACNGISNVSIDRDYDNYVFKLKFDFDTITSLNAAIAKTFLGMADKPLPFSASFNWSQGQYHRVSNFHQSGAFQDLNLQNRKILSSSDYISIVRLPQEIKAVKNNRAKISGNKKAVFLRSNLLGLIDGKQAMENTILMK